MRPFNVPDGYTQVRLSLGSRQDTKTIGVHILIASTFLPNPEQKPTVNHINKNKHDNSLVNLEWATYKEQVDHHLSFKIEEYRHMPKYDTTVIDNEIWKEIQDHPNYHVSNHGRLRNPNGKVLMGHVSNGYIDFRIGQSKKHIHAHRAVAEAFLENFTHKCVINHKNGIRSDNRADNLECVTQSENIKHAHDIKINTRIPLLQCDKDGNIINRFKSYVEAAEVTGFTDTGIRYAIKNANGCHKGFIWKIDEDLPVKAAKAESTTRTETKNVIESDPKAVTEEIFKLMEEVEISTRSRKPPPPELIEIGILNLPKYVLWSASEAKFVIEKHPKLLNDVKNQVKKKPILSGTKQKIPILQKFNLILKTLIEMNTMITNG